MKTKKCTKCNYNKQIIDFGKDGHTKDSLKTKCKSCRNQEQKQYIKLNSNKIKSQNKKYRENNKEKISIYLKTYRQENKERLNNQTKEWRKLNKDKDNNKNDNKTYIKNCPRCNFIIIYASKCSKNKSVKQNTVCKSCMFYPNRPYEKNKKWCSKCKTNKPFNLFNKNPKGKLDNNCKNCRKEYNKKYSKYYRTKNKKTLPVRKKQYYENNKEKISTYGKRYYKDNKKYITQRNKKWARKNIKRVIINHSKWVQENKEKRKNHSRKCTRKRRAQKLKIQENFTLLQEQITYKAFNNQCFNCKSINKLTIDHHRPLSKGNALTLQNAVVLCHSCNSLKHAKNPEDFYGIKKCKQLDKKLKKLTLLNTRR